MRAFFRPNALQRMNRYTDRLHHCRRQILRSSQGGVIPNCEAWHLAEFAKQEK